MPNAYEVRVSAHILNWPSECACCGRPGTQKRNAVATRYTGIEVVRSDSRGWPVPYCDACAEHLHAFDALVALTGDEPKPMARGTAEVVTVCLGLATLWAFMVSIVTAANGWDYLTTGGKAGVVAVILLPYLAAVPAWFHMTRLTAAYEQRRAAHARDMAAANHGVGKKTSRRCACSWPAVDYEGWRGSVHTFQFQRAEYAQAFIEANAGKVV